MAPGGQSGGLTEADIGKARMRECEHASVRGTDRAQRWQRQHSAGGVYCCATDGGRGLAALFESEGELHGCVSIHFCKHILIVAQLGAEGECLGS
jgi:hypothetical protein